MGVNGSAVEEINVTSVSVSREAGGQLLASAHAGASAAIWMPRSASAVHFVFTSMPNDNIHHSLAYCCHDRVTLPQSASPKIHVEGCGMA